MPNRKKYATPASLQRAISDRLRATADAEVTDIERLRRHVAFERLLARLFSVSNPPWILKGGYAMEIRLQSNRATKDVDLAVSERFISTLADDNLLATIRAMFTEAISRDMGDFFTFRIKKSSKLFAPPRGGERIHVSAMLGERLFANFHVDIAIGDVEMLPLAKLSGRSLLAFAGIDCPPFLSIPQEQHFAEKVHAYTTLHDGQMSSRVKDLIDMVLLVKNGKMDAKKLSTALHQTFSRYKRHTLPYRIPPPFDAWRKKFAVLADKCGMELSLEDAHALVNSYYAHLKL